MIDQKIVNIAHNTNLAEYLSSQGLEIKQYGSEYKCIDFNIWIKNNKYYSHYDMDGGDSISCLKKYMNMSFQNAVYALVNSVGVNTLPVIEPIKKEPLIEKKSQKILLPSKSSQIQVVNKYLCNVRKIESSVVNAFIEEGLIYEESKYHGCVFIGRNKEGVIKHAHIRGTNLEKPFKQTVFGSDSGYSFNYINSDSNCLYVFEAPIDMLSYITLNQKDWKGKSYVALCSVAENAIYRILKDYPTINVIHLCLDIDAPGMNAMNRIKEALEKGKKYKVIIEYSDYKDWNDTLIKRKELKQ